MSLTSRRTHSTLHTAPRHGSLGFLPRKRASRLQGKLKVFPKDDASKSVHLTAFVGYKAGCTHIVRDLDKPGSKMHKREIVESVTIIDCPPMIVIGVTGYTETPHGLRCVATAFAQHMSDEAKRRFYRNWYNCKRKAFTKYSKLWEESKETVTARLNKIKKYASVVRVIAHTQVSKVGVHQRKAHIVESQINGGSAAQKVDFAVSLFEKQVAVDSVFQQNEMVDVCGVSRGFGHQGVVGRWGICYLPRKTHRGRRRVACIGAWHPARVSWTVARTGQAGCHQRTEVNKKIYKIGKASEQYNAKTEWDITNKNLSPIGGFLGYGPINNDFLMIKGSVVGPRRRPITIRKACRPSTARSALEQISIKFIDTSSKLGNGRYQTSEEKAKHLGPSKKARVAAAAAKQ